MGNETFKPLYVVQEWSARCYAGCEGCFRSFVSGPVDGDMTDEIFEAANKDIPPGTMILPQFHGDSMNHPRFAHYIQRMKELGLRVSIPVAGFVGERYIPILTEAGTPCYVFIVSLDGYCEYSYMVRRGKIPFTRAERFVEEALRLRAGRPTPWIAVRWVENGQSEVEFERFVKHWLFERGVDFVLRSRFFRYGDSMNSPVSLSGELCHSLQEGNPVVLFNGDVLLCERLPARDKNLLGNVLRDDWPTLMSRRAEYIEHFGRRDPCQLCSAAYLLTGMKGVMQFRHGDEREVYVHGDHSQTFYSLSKEWSGINWSLSDK
jgi:MoaA/NifB/PqqE/SkfB family radical SAM enzyme